MMDLPAGLESRRLATGSAPTPRRMTDWDLRFSEPGFAYGPAPNDFLQSVIRSIPPGPVLTLAEGEGRNAVFLAEHGHDVTAVDVASAGLEKAARLAAEHGVRIATVCADLAEFPLEPAAWDGVVNQLRQRPTGDQIH